MVHLLRIARLWSAVVLVAVVGSSVSPFSWATEPIVPTAQRLRTFSSIAFNREAGDFYGLELTFVPYTGGTYVLWRTASGRIQAPRLLEAIPKGRGWAVQMPQDDDTPGEWGIEVKGQELTAKAPTGMVFKLKRHP